jgi:hypothetical protein
MFPTNSDFGIVSADRRSIFQPSKSVCRRVRVNGTAKRLPSGSGLARAVGPAHAFDVKPLSLVLYLHGALKLKGLILGIKPVLFCLVNKDKQYRAIGVNYVRLTKVLHDGRGLGRVHCATVNRSLAYYCSTIPWGVCFNGSESDCLKFKLQCIYLIFA